MKDFEDFRNNVLTSSELEEIKVLALKAAEPTSNSESWTASFCATFSLHLLADYHEWLHQDPA